MQQTTNKLFIDYKQTEMGVIPESWDEVELKKYVYFIKGCIDELYDKEKNLFDNDLCERCLVFRLAHHLQIKFNEDCSAERYFVDCDYNSSLYYDEVSKEWIRRNGKPISDQEGGRIKKRFIDIIVHKRSDYDESDLICFEIKKWNNCTKKGIEKDKNNLKVLTSQYGYFFGFHLIFGKARENVKLNVFKGNKEVGIIIYE